VAAWAVVSLFSLGLCRPAGGEWAGRPAAAEQAATVVLAPDSAGAAQEALERWRAAATARGWRLVSAASDGALEPGDEAVRLLEARTRQAGADPVRTYLIGEGRSASVAFYAASRRPDLWAAAAAIGGSPRPAVETNRLFAANTQWVPVLWIPHPEDATADQWRQRLRQAGYNLAAPAAQNPSPEQVLAWLEARRRDAFPAQVDCETGRPEFARCYWIELTRLDFTRRNDVLAGSRVSPGTGATLDLGDFAFDAAAPGPGLLVSRLPEGYRGPLRPGDRLVAVGGKELADARAYLEFLKQEKQERRVAVMVLRGRERLRLETRIVAPRREEIETARVQAERLPESGEIEIISRGAAALRLRLPPAWAPARLRWNGLEAGVADQAGCWELSEGSRAAPCAP